MQKNWYRLDTAALIFPAIARRDWSNGFRLSMTLTEEVDPAILQKAAEEMRQDERFESVTIEEAERYFYERRGMKC